MTKAKMAVVGVCLLMMALAAAAGYAFGYEDGMAAGVVKGEYYGEVAMENTDRAFAELDASLSRLETKYPGIRAELGY